MLDGCEVYGVKVCNFFFFMVPPDSVRPGSAQVSPVFLDGARGGACFQICLKDSAKEGNTRVSSFSGSIC